FLLFERQYNRDQTGKYPYNAPDGNGVKEQAQPGSESREKQKDRCDNEVEHRGFRWKMKSVPDICEPYWQNTVEGKCKHVSRRNKEKTCSIPEERDQPGQLNQEDDANVRIQHGREERDPWRRR